MEKIIEIEEAKRIREELSRKEKVLVFTNGCFDLIHRGHIEYLKKAKSLGDILLVAINSDVSVRRIKGKERPIVPLSDRIYILSQFPFIDFLISFNEETPEHLIKILVPNILVKGSDYKKSKIIGSDIVIKNGGRVVTIPLLKGRSSRNIINRILERFSK